MHMIIVRVFQRCSFMVPIVLIQLTIAEEHDNDGPIVAFRVHIFLEWYADVKALLRRRS